MSVGLVERVVTAEDPFEQLRVELLAAALDYAASGQPVLPCYATDVDQWRRAKQPMVRWRDGASIDPVKIKLWWRVWPHAIGLPTGLLYDVLDIDHKPGRPNGYRALARLEEEQLLTGVVRWAQTPSGGCHAYFTASSAGGGDAMPNASYAHVGVDLRGLGGLVIAPPSYVESKSGIGFYRILPTSQDHQGAPLDWRRLDEMLRLGSRPRSAKMSSSPSPSPSQNDHGAAGLGIGSRVAADPDRLNADLVAEVAAAQPGERNVTLFRKACTALEFGLDIEDLITAAVSTGLDLAEVQRTVASAENRVA